MAMRPEQELRQFIVARIDRLEESQKADTARLELKIDGVKAEMTTLKVKVAAFGSIAGSIVTLIAKAILG
jgi:hypothetical protein